MTIVPILSLIVRPHDYEREASMTLLYSHNIIYLSFIDFVKPRNYSILKEKCPLLLQLDYSSFNKDVQDSNIPHPPHLSKNFIIKELSPHILW